MMSTYIYLKGFTSSSFRITFVVDLLVFFHVYLEFHLNAALTLLILDYSYSMSRESRSSVSLFE